MSQPDPARAPTPAPPATSAPARSAHATSAGAAVRAVLVVLVVLGVVLLATWAARTGPGPVLGGGDRPDFAPPASGSSSTSAAPADPDAPEARPRPEDDGGSLAWLAVLLQTLGLLVVAAVAWLVLRRLWRAWASRPAATSRDTVADDRDGEAVPSAGGARARLRATVAEAAPQQRALLLQGAPRNGVVACWQRFEDVAAAASLPRRASETTTEFVHRLLQQAGADPGAVERLAARYREARFSDHPVTEEHRAQALAAFDALASSLHRDAR